MLTDLFSPSYQDCSEPTSTSILFWTLNLIISLPFDFLNSFFRRLTFPTALRWSSTGPTSSRSRTAASCLWRGQTFWRRGSGSSLSLRKAWTTAAWPGSGSSCSPRRCSTHTTAFLNTQPRKPPPLSPTFSQPHVDKTQAGRERMCSYADVIRTASLQTAEQCLWCRAETAELYRGLPVRPVKSFLILSSHWKAILEQTFPTQPASEYLVTDVLLLFLAAASSFFSIYVCYVGERWR